MSYTSLALKTIHASPELIYQAFTRASGLTEWMCDFATVAPRPGGRMYLWWHGDFYSSGEYIAVEKNSSVSFKWFGRFDPAPSEVKVTIEQKDDGCLVTMAHSVPEGPGWMRRADDFAKEWTSTLGNLAQVLETGLDKRTFDRPMLGIQASDFNADIARTLGIPVTEGIRLDTLPEGFGAYKAGLRKDDVIVQLAGQPISNDFGSLVTALQGKKGGDKVEVTFYRGSEQQTVTMELTRRPVPQIPWTAQELSTAVREKYAQGLSALEKTFAPVSEEAADVHPEPDGWSAKEVLAHLIHTERHWLEDLDDQVSGFPRLSDEWAGNSSAHVRATVQAYGSSRALLDELNRLAEELARYLACLPDEYLARKSSYLQTAVRFLDGSLPHTLSHLEQIETALAAARK
jgi:uncharacterized protein YndB with AHSA1/START domain/uncharacterized damage-inducible protein DinB